MPKIALSKKELQLTTKELASKYKLTIITARRSLKRGYMVTNYHTNTKAASKEIQSELMKVLSFKYWNYAGFNLKDVVSSVKAGRRQLSETDANNLKKQIAEVKDTITYILDCDFSNANLTKEHDLYGALLKLTKDKRVKALPIFGGGKTAVQAIDNLRKGFPLKADQVKSVVTNLEIESLEFYDLFNN